MIIKETEEHALSCVAKDYQNVFFLNRNLCKRDVLKPGLQLGCLYIFCPNGDDLIKLELLGLKSEKNTGPEDKRFRLEVNARISGEKIRRMYLDKSLEDILSQTSILHSRLIKKWELVYGKV